MHLPDHEDKQSSKRMRPSDSPQSNPNDTQSTEIPHLPLNVCEWKTAPDDVHPWVRDMLIHIRKNTSENDERFESLDQRVNFLEDSCDSQRDEIASLKVHMNELHISNKTLIGRLVRAETTIQKQNKAIADLTARSMRENLIFKTSGQDYKESRNEDTAAIIRRFLATEMHIADAGDIVITRAHRMGQANGDSNRPMIAKFPFDSDIRRIFSNVKVLKGTKHSITSQIPSEYNERRQFGWEEYKAARKSKTSARFEGGRLFIQDELKS